MSDALKPAILALALLILGCGNKPMPTTYPAVSYRVDNGFIADEWSGVILYIRKASDDDREECESASFCVTTLPNGGTSVVAGPVGVTPAQWEAAQGLYNPHVYHLHSGDADITITGIWISSEPKDSEPTLFYKDGKRMTYGELRRWKTSIDTFPPSGDAK